MKSNTTALNTIIETYKHWTADRVRGMCIDNDYYTRGNNTAYAAMLDFVANNEPTDTAVYIVARDIVQHSDLSAYGQSCTENIESVMFALANDAIITSYKVITDPAEGALTII